MAKTVKNPVGKASKIFLENKNKKIYFKMLNALAELTIAASQITGVELTEDQMLFIRSRQYRKIIIKENIKLIQEFLYGDDEKEIDTQIYFEETQCEETTDTNTEKNKK